jgi:hypothetical protein
MPDFHSGRCPSLYVCDASPVAITIPHTRRLMAVEFNHLAIRPDLNEELSTPCSCLCYLPSHLIECESSTSWKLEGAGKRADDETLLSGLMANLSNPIRIGLRMWGIGTQQDPRPAASRQRDITDLDPVNIHQGLFRCPTSPS